MNKPSGGRGKKAPYETQVIRVPVPIVPAVEKLIDEYRSLAIGEGETEFTENPDIAIKTTSINYSEAILIAKEIVKFKKGAAESLVKMLQVLYGGKIRKEDLKR